MWDFPPWLIFKLHMSKVTSSTTRRIKSDRISSLRLATCNRSPITANLLASNTYLLYLANMTIDHRPTSVSHIKWSLGCHSKFDLHQDILHWSLQHKRQPFDLPQVASFFSWPVIYVIDIKFDQSPTTSPIMYDPFVTSRLTPGLHMVCLSACTSTQPPMSV